MTDWKKMLRVGAGPAALSRLRDSGLAAADLAVVVGPATGPRWIVVAGIDRALADSRWLNKGRDLWLWGASAGAWRFAALAQPDPSDAIRRFQESYAGMHFTRPLDREQVRGEIERALGGFLPRDVESRDALARGSQGPKLAVVTVRQRAALEGMEKTIYLTSLLLNFFHSSAGRVTTERVVFHSPMQPPPPLCEPGFPGRGVALTAANIEKALLASGSVPFKAMPVTRIPGAPRGSYQDGGFLDYHINSSLFPGRDDRLQLLITQPGKILARWLDRFTPWRGLPAAGLDRLVVVQPSPEIIDRLPGRRLPSRKDWEEIPDRKERLEIWNRALETCLPLGEIFMNAVLSGAVGRMAEPLV
jgi:hypothetical protein